MTEKSIRIIKMKQTKWILVNKNGKVRGKFRLKQTANEWRRKLQDIYGEQLQVVNIKDI